MPPTNTSAPPAAPAEKPCRQCRLAIPGDALLCHHCGSHQDWRGHLTLSSSVLALLVALVSVLSVAGPTLVGALRPDRSSLVLSGAVVRDEALYVVASNGGTKPAVIERAVLRSPHVEMPAELAVIHPADALVGPGAKQVGMHIRLRLSELDSRMRALDVILKEMRTDTPAQAGHVEIRSRDSDGRPGTTRLPLTAEDLLSLLESHAERCEGAAQPPSLRNGCMGLDEVRAESRRAHDSLQEAVRKARASAAERE